MRRLTAAAAVVAVIVLAACSPDAADFQSEAEKYIESREFSEAAQLLRFSEAECEEPESTDEDTRYTCVATAEDGTRWQFNVEITGDSDLRVLIPPTQLAAETTDSSTADSAGATTTGPTTTAGATTTTAARASTTTTTTP